MGREASSGNVVVLPLLLTDEKEVFHRYPLLQSKRFEKFEVDKLDQLAANLKSRLDRQKAIQN